MLAQIRRHLSYANVMATIAVFCALGGGAYAATQLPKNSVGAKQIKKNAVSTAKVKDGSLLVKDFKAGQLPTGEKGDRGDKGDQGPQGSQGIPGVAGKNGMDGQNGTDGQDAATNVRYAVASSGGITSGSGGATATCDQPGEKMIGGGGGFVGAFGETFDPASTHVISWNGPMGNPGEAATGFENASAWVVQGTNTTAVATRVYAYAICVKP